MNQMLKLICLLIGLLSAQYACAGLQDGIDAFSKQDYDTALNELQPFAAQGNIRAQEYLGLVYLGLVTKEMQSAEPNKVENYRVKAMQWLA
jgi:hypothetical protein